MGKEDTQTFTAIPEEPNEMHERGSPLHRAGDEAVLIPLSQDKPIIWKGSAEVVLSKKDLVDKFMLYVAAVDKDPTHSETSLLQHKSWMLSYLDEYLGPVHDWNLVTSDRSPQPLVQPQITDRGYNQMRNPTVTYGKHGPQESRLVTWTDWRADYGNTAAARHADDLALGKDRARNKRGEVMGLEISVRPLTGIGGRGPEQKCKEWRYGSPVQLMTQPRIMETVEEMILGARQVYILAYSFDSSIVVDSLLRLIKSKPYGREARVPDVRIIIDGDFYRDGKCRKGPSRLLELMSHGVRIRLGASWPTDMAAAATLPAVGRRGLDGLLGTGEYATEDGDMAKENSPYPLDISNTVARSAVQASARWVPTIVERHFTFLHAKCILTDQALLVGSANWTDNSASRAFELGVLLQTEREIHEAYQLFEFLWTSSEQNEISPSSVKETFGETHVF